MCFVGYAQYNLHRGHYVFAFPASAPCQHWLAALAVGQPRRSRWLAGGRVRSRAESIVEMIDWPIQGKHKVSIASDDSL